MMPGQFGPISRVCLLARYSFSFTMSSAGIPSVMQTITGMPASAASITASASNADTFKVLTKNLCEHYDHAFKLREQSKGRRVLILKRSAPVILAVAAKLLTIQDWSPEALKIYRRPAAF